MNSSNHRGKFSKFLNGKGFYIALAVCLVGAGASAWVVVDRTLGSLNEGGPSISDSSASSSSEDWGFPELEEAEQKTPGIVVSSEASSSQPTQSSSPEQPSEPEDNSEQQVLSPKLPELVCVFPLRSAQVINQFSGDELVKNETLNKWSTHNGADFKANVGDEVLAVTDGVVTRIYKDPLWGNTVELTHKGDITSVYCGLADEIPVAEGDNVSMEQVIGAVGETNIAEVKMPAHLHFSMKKGDEYLDPLKTMGKLDD